MAGEASAPQIQGAGCLSLVAIALVAGLLARCGVSSPKPLSPERQAEIAEQQARMEKLKADLEHPLVKASFQAGYNFGQRHKATGMARLTEQQLDGYALAASAKLKVPADLRRYSIEKFKSGYGWGYWNTQ